MDTFNSSGGEGDGGVRIIFRYVRSKKLLPLSFLTELEWLENTAAKRNGVSASFAPKLSAGFGKLCDKFSSLVARTAEFCHILQRIQGKCVIPRNRTVDNKCDFARVSRGRAGNW